GQHEHHGLAAAGLAQAHGAALLVAEGQVQGNLRAEPLLDADLAQLLGDRLLGARGRTAEQQECQRWQRRAHQLPPLPLTLTPKAAARFGSASKRMACAMGICTTPAFSSTQSYSVSFFSSSRRRAARSASSLTCSRGTGMVVRIRS